MKKLSYLLGSVRERRYISILIFVPVLNYTIAPNIIVYLCRNRLDCV